MVALTPVLKRLTTAALLALCPLTYAAERVTLRNGFAYDCSHKETAGDKVRLYTTADNYIEVPAQNIVSTEAIPDPPPPPAVLKVAAIAAPTTLELHQLIATAGAKHNIDADLLAAVVRAESGNQPHAVSRTGARGLMQLMPGTARQLGVKDSFAPDQNINGGTAYLDQLLTRYHDNIAFALAAYNAGPGAVDKHHGVPPYRETRAYVARIIREFNRRKKANAALLAAAM